jgi:hypothetical protein
MGILYKIFSSFFVFIFLNIYQSNQCQLGVVVHAQAVSETGRAGDHSL